MEHIKIGYTDIIFQEMGNGRGKIIISDNEYGYNSSYYWGSMGKDTTLKQFISSMGTDYFVKNLSSRQKGPMNLNKTFANLRAYLKESFLYELPWYEHLEFQKDFRKRLKECQKTISDNRDFIDSILSFYEKLDYYLIKDIKERRKVENIFKDVFSNSEPWYFVEHKTHPEEIFFTKLHQKLKSKLSKPIQLCLF